MTRASHPFYQVSDGSTKGAQTSQPRATPWVSFKGIPSPERAADWAALSGLSGLCVATQGDALGWLVFGPLARNRETGMQTA